MDLSDKIEPQWLSAILSDTRSAAPDVDFLVVGAIARDLLLHYGQGVPITCATTVRQLHCFGLGRRKIHR